MSKKNFKDNTANIDRFFSGNDTQMAEKTQLTDNTLNADNAQMTPEKPYRINLHLRPQFRQYLDDEAWKARKSITAYLNDLIQADMDKKKESE